MSGTLDGASESSRSFDHVASVAFYQQRPDPVTLRFPHQQLEQRWRYEQATKETLGMWILLVILVTIRGADGLIDHSRVDFQRYLRSYFLPPYLLILIGMRYLPRGNRWRRWIEPHTAAFIVICGLKVATSAHYANAGSEIDAVSAVGILVISAAFFGLPFPYVIPSVGAVTLFFTIGVHQNVAFSHRAWSLSAIAGLFGVAAIVVAYVHEKRRRGEFLAKEMYRQAVRDLQAAEAARRLDENSRLTWLTNFAHFLGHELKTPLGVALKKATTLRVRTNQGEDDASYEIARIVANLTRADHILREAAKAARLEQAVASSLRETFDLTRSLREWCDDWSTFLHNAPILEIRHNHPILVFGDARHIEQMLNKLVSNASDFAVPGTVVSVVLDVVAESDSVDSRREVIIQVKNRGPSLPSDKTKLFDPFVSIRDEERAAGGHIGIGLYVAQCVARSHGGVLEAKDESCDSGESEVTFSVRIPIGKVPPCQYDLRHLPLRDQ
jgi:signal transduction histidine kinase